MKICEAMRETLDKRNKANRNRENLLKTAMNFFLQTQVLCPSLGAYWGDKNAPFRQLIPESGGNPLRRCGGDKDSLKG